MAHTDKILIVEAPYYTEIVDLLVQGAVGVLEAEGRPYERIVVPGAFEIPAAVACAASGDRNVYAGYVVLGCVVRGETTHYDYVCTESARGLMDLALAENLAIGYGILTVENRDQAMARARRDRKDKGGEAARACLRMIELKKHFGTE